MKKEFYLQLSQIRIKLATYSSLDYGHYFWEVLFDTCDTIDNEYIQNSHPINGNKIQSSSAWKNTLLGNVISN